MKVKYRIIADHTAQTSMIWHRLEKDVGTDGKENWTLVTSGYEADVRKVADRLQHNGGIETEVVHQFEL
jgi:hypothetical protein